jgi:hypothetical protein
MVYTMAKAASDSFLIRVEHLVYLANFSAMSWIPILSYHISSWSERILNESQLTRNKASLLDAAPDFSDILFQLWDQNQNVEGTNQTKPKLLNTYTGQTLHSSV